MPSFERREGEGNIVATFPLPEEVAATPVKTPYDGLRLTYIANSGFLIEAGSKKILIDGAFSGPPGLSTLSREVQNKIKLAQAPFDGIDLILATHTDLDHFSAAIVANHLKNNPGAYFASTQQAASMVGEMPGRVIAFNPSSGRPETRIIAGVEVEAILLLHPAHEAGGEKFTNLAFLVTVEGRTLFHTGDCEYGESSGEELRSYQLAQRGIDLAFVPYFFLDGNPILRAIVEEKIGARYLIPCHYDFGVPAIDPSAILRQYPKAVMFSDKMEEWIMPETSSQ